MLASLQKKSSFGVQHYGQADLDFNYQTCKLTVAIHFTAWCFLFNVPICQRLKQFFEQFERVLLMEMLITGSILHWLMK